MTAILIVTVLIAVRGANIGAAWLKNLANVELIPHWLIQATQFLDPPCPVSKTYPDIRVKLQNSYVLAPKDNRVLTYLGRLMWLEGKCDEAITQWEHIYATTGDWGAAYELFRVGQYKDLNLDTRLSLADMLYKQTENQESDDVYAIYSRVLGLVPEVTESLHWQMIGEIALVNNEIGEAAQAFSQAAILAQNSAELWIKTGEVWESDSNWEQAENAYEEAINANPNIMWPRIKLGNIYQLKGQYQDSLRLYFQAMDIAPDYSDPYYHLGVTYYLMKEYVQAQYYLEKSIDLVPEHASAKYQLAQVMYEQEDLQLAESWLLDAVDNYPEAPLSWWIQLGDWRLDWGDCAEAKATYLFARELGENVQLVEQKLTKVSSECD